MPGWGCQSIGDVGYMWSIRYMAYSLYKVYRVYGAYELHGVCGKTSTVKLAWRSSSHALISEDKTHWEAPSMYQFWGTKPIGKLPAVPQPT